MAEKIPALLLISSLFLFTALIITLTHSGFQCDVDTTSGRTKCINYHIDEDKEIVCQGNVFQINAQEGSTDVIILCPWSFWTTFTNFVGVLLGLVFAALTILQRLQREFGTRKFAVRLGVISAFMLAISTIVMGTNISGGLSECEKFEAALGDNNSDADCSVAAFGWDLALMCLGVIVLGVEAFLEYRKYRFGDDTTEFAKDEVTTEASDYHVRFFEDN